jgi:aspartokinase
MVSVYGPDFRERPGLAGIAFAALADADVNILAVSTSISTISCIVANDQADQALTALHGAFDLP